MTLPTDAVRAVPRSIKILGVPVSAIDMHSAIDAIAGLIGARVGGYVCVPDSYNMMLARQHPAYRRVLEGAAMVTPDGQPLVWMGKIRGEAAMDRVSGIDLLPAVCERSRETGWRHFFYGGADGVAEILAARLSRRYPGLDVVGVECPPFRPLSEAEKSAAVRRIRQSGADIVWVGLGCPKQERWMAENASRLPDCVLIGVGAAFDIHAGRIARAPEWMRRRGLESVFRLMREPRRLWRRYVLYAPRFVLAGLAESLAIRVGLLGGRRAAAALPQHPVNTEFQHGVKS